MKWFKHFSDNHRGRSVQGLFDEMGHIGPCCMFFLMEMCAEKLERIPNKTLESSDCLFEFHERIVRQNLRISSTKLKNFLNICQGFGLLSFEFSGNILKISMPILLDLLDYDHKKTRQRRARVVNLSALESEQDTEKETEQESDVPGRVNKSPKPVRKKPSSESTELNKKIWQSYFDAYLKRYKTEPIRNATVNTQISNLGKRLGEDAVEVVAFFVSSNNGFYLQKLHQVGLCLADAESLHTQWRRGRAITQADVRSFEKTQTFNDTLNRIESGEI